MKWPTNAVQTTIESPLGPMRLCATPQGLSGLWFHNQSHLPDTSVFGTWPAEPRYPLFLEVQRQLQAYFANPLSRFEVPLDLSCGTPFQTEVWQCLLSIPKGGSRSYGAIAEAIGRPAAVRAVGAAIGRNPVSIIVPCHRVLGANGALTGYAGGLVRKTHLLHMEGVLPPRAQLASISA